MSLALNLVVVVGLVHLAFPRTLAHVEPQSIAVDLVPEEPKDAGKAPQGKNSVASPAPPSEKPPGNASAASAPVKPDAAPAKPDVPPAAPEPPAAATTQPPKPADTLSQPEPPPAEPSSKPSPDRADTAKPAPIEGGSNPAPRLVAAPEAPQTAVTQAERPVVANAATDPAGAAKVTEAPPRPMPTVLAHSDAGTDTVPQPSTAAPVPRPSPEPSAEDKKEADNTARLSAALPFAADMPPTFARAAQAASGAEAEQRYRGAVYSQFHKADDLIEQARTAHLRGQTVVEFAVDDAGALTAVRVAVSSGNPAVDRIAEDIIRRSAPFPPPPPGAQHVFSPAIRLGLDD